MAGAAVMNQKFDWCFNTVPQKGVNNRVTIQPRGKVLGGSSATNFLVTDRASAGEYDALEQMCNPGWNWDNLLEYFKKAETFHFPDRKLAKECKVAYQDKYHGSKGPIHSTHPSQVWDLYHPTQKAFGSCGISVNPDPEGGVNTGFVFTTSSVNPTTATRSFSTTGYYEPNAERPNLIVTQKLSGKTYKVSVKREVIVSAGIEKKDVLSKFNIPQLLELPVGDNLQDHCYARTTLQVASHHITADKFFGQDFAAREMENYQKTQGGAFASSTHTAYSYRPLSSFVSQEDIRAIERKAEAQLAENNSLSLIRHYELYKYWLADNSKAQVELFMHPGFVPGEGQDLVLAPGPDACYMTFISVLLHPFSDGSVHLQSADPLAAPAIDPGYLSNPIDLEILARSVLFTRKLAQTDALQERVVKHVRPEPSLQSLDDIKEYCKSALCPIYHPVGTAPMLPKARGGVVDSNLKVYGTANARVIDASVLPVELSAHLQSSLYGLAEKASLVALLLGGA
ncbi:alcohol oxidase [Heliocybe sulcata]|uniref:Alcohol oxidase n=1 Tax=Heliocybe sulcata TaxID=5364 RepID=A0A5C3MZ02_9AGAM|nr:alcohol oxidase [Heliocybe sulcata]